MPSVLSEGQSEHFAHFLLCREVLKCENEQTEPLENENVIISNNGDGIKTRAQRRVAGRQSLPALA